MKTKFHLIMNNDRAIVAASFEVDVDWLPMTLEMDMSTFTPARAVLREITIGDDKDRYMKIKPDHWLKEIK